MVTSADRPALAPAEAEPSQVCGLPAQHQPSFGPALKPVHDWVTGFERTWTERLDRLERFLAETAPEPETSSDKEQS